MKLNKIDPKWSVIHSYYEMQNKSSYCIFLSEKSADKIVYTDSNKALIKPIKSSLLRKCLENRLKGLAYAKLYILKSNDIFESLKFLKYKIPGSRIIIIKDTNKTIAVAPFIVNLNLQSNLNSIKFNLIANSFKFFFRGLKIYKNVNNDFSTINS